MKKLRLLLAFCALLLGWSNASAQGWTASEVAAGNFYLYNVGANAYLENGACWGTHAALKNGGFVVNVAAVGNGKYTIGTDSKYSGKFFTQNGYVDTGNSTNWTFEPVEGKANTYRLKTDEGYYAIAASGMYNVTFRNEGDNEAYWWKLVTGDNRNAGTNATYLNPVEWTHKINNPRFDDNVDGWSGTAPARGGNNSGTNGNEASWDIFNPCAEHYNKTYDTYQELTGLSNGVYAVSVQGFYREGGYNDAAAKHVAGTESLKAILYANDAEQPLMSIFEEAGKASGGKTATATGIDGAFPNDMAAASYFFSAGLYWNTVYVQVTNGTLRIGVKKSTAVGADWTIFDSFRLQYYGNDCTVEQVKNAVFKKAWDDAYSVAVSARDNAAYANVVGAERTALNTEIAKEEPTTAEGYETATQSLSTATSNFIAAAPNYVLLATEKTKAENLGLSAAAIAEVTPLTKTGLKALQDLKVAEYNYVTTNYAYGVELGAWTSTGTNTSAADFNNEHWSGETHSYKNQNDNNGQGWNASSWSINFNQNVLLPAGTYVFKVAGRQASGDQVTTSLVVKKGEDVLGSVNDFPRSNSSRGINKSGETDFEGDNSEFANGGKGYGWEWRYVKFTLAEEATVNIAVNSVATALHQWVSFGDYTLQADNDDVVNILAYNVAKANAITIRDDARYASVTGSERTALINAINADPTSDYPIATTALNDASNAVVAAAPSYDAYLLAKGYGEAINSTLLPYASTAKLTAVTEALETSVTSAATAVTATTAINTANRAAYESNMNAEGVAGATDRTSLIKNADGNNTAGWSGSFGTMSNEPYTDASGSSTNTYFDKNSIKSFTSSQTIKLVAGTYILSVTARAQAGIDSYKLKVTNNADETEEVALTAMGSANGVFNRGWNVATVEFTQKAFGDATISIVADNTKSDANFWMSWDRFRLVSIDEEGGCPVEVTSAGWATYCSPYALDLANATGLTDAYIVTGATGSVLNTTSVKGGTIPANTGILIEAPEGTVTIPVVASSSTSVSGNKFQGVTEATEIDADAGYVLMGSPKVGFYQNEKAFTVGANTAYLPADFAEVTGGARSAYFFRGDITAVDNVEATSKAAVKEGKFIENGKIVIVKNGQKFNAAGQQVK